MPICGDVVLWMMARELWPVRPVRASQGPPLVRKMPVLKGALEMADRDDRALCAFSEQRACRGERAGL